MVGHQRKYIRDLGGIKHHGDENTSATKGKREAEYRAYRTVEGIRFEEGVPEQIVNAFLELLREDERRFGIDYKDNGDSRCYAELIMYHGSGLLGMRNGEEVRLPVVREPLTPFGLLSGYYSPNEIMRMQHKVSHTAIDSVDIADNSRIKFSGAPRDMQKFLDFLKKNAEGKRGERAEYILTQMQFDEKSGKNSLPFLQTVIFGTHPAQKRIDVPEELTHKILIKEMRDEGLTDKFGVPVLIDQQGWRLDANVREESTQLI